MSNRSVGRKILLGRVGKPHGLRGWVFLHYFGQDIKNLIDYKNIFFEIDLKKIFISIDKIKVLNDRLTVHLKGHNDRLSAEKLRNQDIFISTNELPSLDDNTFYWYELEGLLVVNLELEVLGKVSYLFHTGANDIMCIHPTESSLDDKERLIPFLPKENSITVSLKDGTISLDWKSDFLIS